MSFRPTRFLLMAVLAISTVAASPRTLLERPICRQACTAARNNAGRLQNIIAKGHNICTCKCTGGGYGDGWTPMHVSARFDCDSCLGVMVDAPSNCDKMAGDANGNTILHIGAQFCRTTTVEEAIRWYGLNIDLPNLDDRGNTALCIAASQNIQSCGGIVRNLINGGANKCVECGNGKTPCENSVHPHVRNVLNDEGACNCR